MVASGSGIHVFLNGGDGQFGGPNVINATNVSRLTVADVNGDGVPDLVCATNSNDITIFHGAGGGTFGDPVTVDVGAHVLALGVGSLAEPGRADIAAVGGDGKVRVLVANSDGLFEVALELDAGVNSYGDDLLVAGVSGGELSDIVVSYSGADQVSLLRPRGNLQFFEPSVVSVAGAPHRLAAGHLFGEEVLDLVVLCQSEVAVLASSGRDRLKVSGRYFAGYFPNSVALADVNGNGVPDMIVGSNEVVAVLPGTEPGQFGEAVPVFTPFGSGPQRVAAADLNGDGRVDIAAAGGGTAMLNILISE